MPYPTMESLPNAVKNTLPEKAQHIWRAAFNAANTEDSDETTCFAIAWAAVRNAGFSKLNGVWVYSSGVAKNFEFKIEKSDHVKCLVFGWAMVSRDIDGNEVWDLQDDNIDPEDLEEMAYKYVQFFRDMGERHMNSGRGVVVESVVTTLEKQQAWGVPPGIMPVGWWVGFYVADPDAWEKVLSGAYDAFSIEGTAERREVM